MNKAGLKSQDSVDPENMRRKIYKSKPTPKYINFWFNCV